MLTRDYIDGNNCAVRGISIKHFRSKDAEQGYNDGLRDMLYISEDLYDDYAAERVDNNGWGTLQTRVQFSGRQDNVD